jgi:hypothetical protein
MRQGIERLILGRRRHRPILGQVTQDSRHCRRAQTFGIPPSGRPGGTRLPMMSKETDDPTPVREFGPAGVGPQVSSVSRENEGAIGGACRTIGQSSDRWFG